jgi:nucleoside-diphosphate-sugar epimerase
MTRESGPVLVTGGAGFLGGAIVDRLLERGLEVRSFSRGDYPALRERGVELFRGDLGDGEAVERAVSGCRAVFHVSAQIGAWGRYQDFHRTNVEGTEHILRACRQHGVAKLIYTSTPSVVHAGGDIEGADESLPYATHFDTHYPKTKAIAEQAVLAANGPDFSTVALRPHLIWGPGDNQLIPRLIDRSKKGRIALVGDGQKKVDGVYVDNAADAHLNAFDALVPEAACAGKAYFITNDAPLPIAELMNGILAAAGEPPIGKHVPAGLAVVLGAVLEGIWWTLRLSGEPPMTRFVARQLSTAHWYDISAARKELGYAPQVSTEEGLRRLAEHLNSSD